MLSKLQDWQRYFTADNEVMKRLTTTADSSSKMCALCKQDCIWWFGLHVKLQTAYEGTSTMNVFCIYLQSVYTGLALSTCASSGYAQGWKITIGIL